MLVLSPHTDDGELGAGGLLSQTTQKIKFVTFSTVKESIPNGLPKDTLKVECKLSMMHLGITDYDILDYPVRRFDEHRQDILEQLIVYKKSYKPDMVLVPCRNDQHQDHQIITSEAIRAFKTSACILGYEEPWSVLGDNLNFFTKLTAKDIDHKWDALSQYKSQIGLRQYFTRDFMFGLATMRGVQCNTKYAEAFEVIRWQQ